MKHTCKIIVLVFCIVFMMIAAPAGAYKECVCLDANGKTYTKSDPGSSKCYSCTDDGCMPNGMTLDRCREKNAASAPAPVVEQPAAPAPAPVVEQPAAPAPAPVVEQPAAPAPAPVVEQPAAPAPAPVVEQPAAPAPAPVVEQPAAPAPAPVFEQPAAPAPAPVVEQPAAPAPAPVVEQPAAPAPAPVVEQPAAPAPAPVVEEQQQPAPVFVPVVEEQQPAAPIFVPVEEQQPAAPALVPVTEDPYPSYEGPEEDPYGSDEPAPAPVMMITLNNSGSDDPEDGPSSDVPAAGPETGGSSEGENILPPDDIPAPVTQTVPASPDTGNEPADQPAPESVPVPVMIGDGSFDTPDAGTETNPDDEETIPVPVIVFDGGTEDGPAQDEQPESPEPVTEGTEDPGLTAGTDENAGSGESGSEPGVTDPEVNVPETGTAEPAADDPEAAGTEADPEAQGTEEADPEAEVTPDPEAEVTLDPEAEATPEPEEQEDKNLLKSSPVLGDITDITLSEPNGTTEKSADVTLVWAYSYDTSSGETDVDFTLTLNITDTDTSAVISTTETIPSASCSGVVCSYSAGSELSDHKNASVSWDVSVGSVSSGNGPFSFTLKQEDPTPEPTPVPKPAAPVLECPKGEYKTRDLGFYWAPSANAETYTVNWSDDKGHHGSFNLSNSDSTCQKGRCIAHATMPGTGHYSWTVTAKNASGTAKSKSMKFEIVTNISTPRPYSPNGYIGNHNYPAFEWEDVRDGAVEYRIQVVGKYDNRIRMDRWFSVKDIYVGNGLCYVQTDLFLPAGTYCWRVQAKNKSFTSGWSEWRDFTVQYYYVQSNVNTVPNVSYPVGTIMTNTPDFQWRMLTGAAYYQVKLLDASGHVLLDSRVPSSNCSGDLCTWKPGYKLPKNGNYSWSVSGYGSNGAFWNSSSGSFTLQAPVVMKDMSFLSPVQNGYLSAESPMVIWTDPGEGAVAFSVEIFDRNNTQLFNAVLTRDQAWCDGISCAIEFKSIPDADNYRIRVTPYSEYNDAGKAADLVFSKGVKPIALNSPKAGSTVTSRPLFRWAAEAGAAYELILTDAENNVTTYSPLVCGGEGVNCDAGEAFFSPAAALPAGVYSARIVIQGAPAAGDTLQFTVK